MPTTQCQIGPRFSAVQPPGELIPCHAIKLPDIPVQHPFSGRRNSRKFQRFLYIPTVYRCYDISLNQSPADTTAHRHLRRNLRQRPTKLTAYDSTTCSRRADTTRHSKAIQPRPPCAIPFRFSHYAQQQSPPSSSPTCNHSSPPYPYRCPTISHLL